MSRDGFVVMTTLLPGTTGSGMVLRERALVETIADGRSGAEVVLVPVVRWNECGCPGGSQAGAQGGRAGGLKEVATSHESPASRNGQQRIP